MDGGTSTAGTGDVHAPAGAGAGGGHEGAARLSPANNVFDCALVLEGGGMRASYTAGLVNVLLEQGIYFDYACGISAGSSHTVDYLSRDAKRTKEAFVELAGNPNCGGIHMVLRGRPYFNADYDYAGCVEDGFLPFDWQAFSANPARLRIQGFRPDDGRSVTWTRDDMPTQDQMMLRVRAGSTLPKLMAPVEVDGHVMLDGGLGEGAGMPTHLAEMDGFRRLFVITSRERGYRKEPLSKTKARAVSRLSRGYPPLREALLTRSERYNAALDHLAELEAEGRAYVVRPDTMPVKNTDLSVPKLQAAYELGHAQGMRELPRWREFLFGTGGTADAAGTSAPTTTERG
jgi:predicted patatin/cPLA2 family phospholipase